MNERTWNQRMLGLTFNAVDAEALDMLKLRLQMAKSSVKKYQAAERCVCPDGRARGLFQFYGASRTGRYAGRNIQLQNLPQNHISTLDEARTLVKMGCFEMLESIYGNTPDVLSQLIRTMLIKSWCAENGIPLSSFYSWQRKMRSALLRQESVQFEELSLSSPKTAAIPPTQITLHIRDVTVELPADLPSDQISEIIRGIRNAG